MGRNCVLSNAKPIGVVAAISSGVQGLIWASVYLVMLLQRYCVFSVGNEQPPTFKQYLVSYITSDQCPGSTKGTLSCVPLSGPEMLLPWLVIGVFGNLILAISSLALALVLVKCSKETHFAFINTWIFFGLTTFIVDAGFTYFFAVDFMKLQASTCLGDRGLAAVAVAFLLLISTRGLLLTIANLTFIVFFFAASVKLYIKYKIRNKEIDLISDWPSASSENSLFDFYNNKSKSDVVGIVNPIQEYPEYSAKGRWPTLRETAEQSRPPLRAWETRSDLVDSETLRRDQAIVNNNNLINQQQSGSARMRKYITVEPTSSLTSSRVKMITEKLQPVGKFENPREYSVPSVSSLPSRNRNIQRVEIRTNPPNPSTTNTPPAPPLPTAPVMNSKLKIATIPQFEASTKFSSPPAEEAVKVAEPDYTPPAVRKPFETVTGTPSGPRSQFAMMSLHEAIKSRPPLKPVFSRLKSTDC